MQLSFCLCVIPVKHHKSGAEKYAADDIGEPMNTAHQPGGHHKDRKCENGPADPATQKRLFHASLQL